MAWAAIAPLAATGGIPIPGNVLARSAASFPESEPETSLVPPTTPAHNALMHRKKMPVGQWGSFHHDLAATAQIRDALFEHVPKHRAALLPHPP